MKSLIKNNELIFNHKVNTLGIFISSAISIYYFIFRLGFDDNNIFDIYKVLCLSLSLILLPETISVFARKKNKKWYFSNPFYLIISLFLFSTLGVFSLFFNINLTFITNILAPILLAYHIFLSFRIKNQDKLIRFSLFIIFSSFIPFFIYKTILQDPLFLEKIILGTAHIDEIYLAGISNLIKTYNIPTIGIDGLVYLPYHWGSHFIYAYLSALIDLDSFKFYNLAYPIVFIPFLFKAFYYFLVELRKIRNIPIDSNLFVFLLLFIALVGITPNLELNQSPLMTTILVLSESYLLGLALSFIFITLTVSYFRLNDSSRQDFFFPTIFVPIFIALISIVKISSGFLISGLFFFFFFRLAWYKKMKFWISAIISAAVFIFIFIVATPLGGGTKDSQNILEIFSFLKRHVDSKFYFLFFYYLYTLIFIIILVLILNINSLKRLFSMFRDRLTLEAEALIVLSIIGFIPGVLMNTIGRNSLYFMDLQRWMAILLIGAYFPLIIKSIKENSFKLTAKNIIFIMPIIIAISMSLVNTPRNYYLHVKQAIIHNIYTRNEINKESNNNFTHTFSSLIKNFNTEIEIPQKAKQKIAETTLLYQLRELSNLPRKEKQKSCIYIPKTNKLYWNILKYKTNGIPFVAPFLSGICMIEGVPEVLPLGFGYYTVAYNKNANKIFSDDEILKIAKDKGFEQVFVIKHLSYLKLK